MINELLKAGVIVVGLILVFVLNSLLFDFLFELDYAYLKSTAWKALFVFGAALAEIIIVRAVMGRLKIKVTWE